MSFFAYLALNALFVIVTVGLLLIARTQTRKIWHAVTSTSANLGFSPTSLGLVDVVIIFCIVLFKPLLRVLGLVPKLRPSSNDQGFLLPRIRLYAPLQIDGSHRRNFQIAIRTLIPIDDVYQSDISESQPSLLLAAQTTPLMLLTVANHTSPILPFGAVNVRNRFEFLDREQCARCEGTFSILAASGGANSPGRRTKRGIEFDVTIEIWAAAAAGSASTLDSSQPSIPIFRQIITVMQPLSKHMKPLYKGDREGAMQPQSTPAPSSSGSSGAVNMHLRVPTHAPTQWARICRDYNPIHMSAVAGRFLGLPGRIAHGNHVAAAALYLLQKQPGRLPNGSWAMDVAFRRPMVLPTELELSITTGGGGNPQFAVTKAEKVFVEGSIETL